MGIDAPSPGRRCLHVVAAFSPDGGEIPLGEITTCHPTRSGLAGYATVASGPNRTSVRSAAAPLERMVNAGGSHNVLGIGSAFVEGCDPEESLAEARRVGRLALALGRSGIVISEDVAVASILEAAPSMAGPLASVLAPLGEDADRLIAVLEALYVADLSVGRAAEMVGVHRHTFATRLREVEGLLGLSVRSGTDRLLVEVALIARRLATS